MLIAKGVKILKNEGGEKENKIVLSKELMTC